MIDLTIVYGFFSGMAFSSIVLYRYISSRISVKEADLILKSAKEIITEYNKAKEDGIITNEEKLLIADKAINLLSIIIKSIGGNYR